VFSPFVIQSKIHVFPERQNNNRELV